jgi:hypothetical protein
MKKAPFCHLLLCFVHLVWPFFWIYQKTPFFAPVCFFWFFLLWGILRAKPFFAALSVGILVFFQTRIFLFSSEYQPFFLFFLFFYAGFLFFELSSSYYRSHLNWYEGKPACFPVQCRVYYGPKLDGLRLHFQPAQLSLKGLIACADEDFSESCRLYDQVRVGLTFRGKSVFVSAVIMQVFRSGIGLKFFFPCQDEKKMLAGFLQHLRLLGLQSE